jgi:hypothetical protein
MAFALTVTSRGDYLEFSVKGEWTLENVYGLLEAVRREADSQHFDRVLVDARAVTGAPAEMARFKAGVRAAEVLGAKIRLAALTPAALVNKFGENAAVNRGARLRVLGDPAQALAWLLQGQEPNGPQRPD